MKLNIEVDLSEFYAENFKYDGERGASPSSSISEEVAQIIRYEVKSAVSTQIRDSVSSIAKSEFEKYGEDKIKTIVNHEINAFIENGKIKLQHSKEDISIKEWLYNLFSNNYQVSKVDRAMENIGKQFSEECRKRYDMHFASNIVKGLESQGLLKPGVFEAITKDA